MANGTIGLRQSEALFFTYKSPCDLLNELMSSREFIPQGIGVSDTPRRRPQSYMPCFAAGLLAAKAIAASHRIPLFFSSHHTGHIAAGILGTGQFEFIGEKFLAFHLSGGTTDVLLVEDLLKEKLTQIGGSADLKAGQIVDRVGKMLGLNFPAGMSLDLLAQDSNRSFTFKSAINDGYVCLSGIENQCQRLLDRKEHPSDVAKFALLAIQEALRTMIELALKQTGCTRLLFVGGVMSNSLLRSFVQSQYDGVVADGEYSSDNAAGTAFLAALRMKNGVKPSWP